MATTYLRDPDGGVNELKKAAQLGLLENAEPESDLGVSFPKHGFSSDLTNIPQITFGTIWSYMIDRVEMKKQLIINCQASCKGIQLLQVWPCTFYWSFSSGWQALPKKPSFAPL